MLLLLQLQVRGFTCGKRKEQKGGSSFPSVPWRNTSPFYRVCTRLIKIPAEIQKCATAEKRTELTQQLMIVVKDNYKCPILLGCRCLRSL